jgi:CheY-like chemotaxis protein
MAATQCRILVVEDDPLVAGAMCAMLRVAGHAPAIAATGAEALAAVAAGDQDLVLLDVGLPDLPGAEVCRRIRHELGAWALPVIATSGYDDAARRLEMSEAGADDFISKPVCRAELLARVRNQVTVRTSYQQAELERRAAERDATRWRLVADCSIATATAGTYGELVAGLARVMRIELGTTDVAYFGRTKGVWAMAAASGGSIWSNVLVLVVTRTAARGVAAAKFGDEHVYLVPVRAEGELRGYLAITSDAPLPAQSERLLGEIVDHIGAVIATHGERRSAAQPSPTSATMRLPRFFVDN